MKVVGFSIIKNAEIFDYPVCEAIHSILPLCDEVVVAVGKSTDQTLELVRAIHPQKIKIIETVWDENLREGGRVLAAETNKAFQAIAKDADWCVYIQADEIVHQDSLNSMRESMLKWKDDKRVEGLLLNFVHFYGSYNYVADAYNWYRKEIRVIRRDNHIISWGDAQEFRKVNGEKLAVKETFGIIHHYGYVKTPAQMMTKAKAFTSLFHSDEKVAQQFGNEIDYDFYQIDSLKKFEGKHPSVMHTRIKRMNWNFEFDTSKSKMKLKYRIRKWLEKLTGKNIGEYRNYKLI